MRVLVALFLLCATAIASGAPRPNIVFILVDDLGWGDLSCYGQTNWETPRLDEMAREGMRFTNAYAGNTVCAPSRAALLTGQHTGHVYQRGNGMVQFRRDPLDITIATRLRELGYTTAMIGKSGVGCNTDDAALPNDKGFDHFFGVLSHTAAHRNYPREIVRNGERIELPGNAGKTGDTYANGLWVDDALSWIEANREGPFFLHLSLTPPHADLTVPERYMAPFRGRWPEEPHTTGGYYHQPEPRAAYAGMVAFIDESVGRVLDRLEALGIAENTLVLFASDNGPHFEGGTNPEVFDSNGPYRDGKRDMTDGGLKTAQIAWWPGTVPAGATSELVTAFWDFPPTALELAGGESPSSMDGISIAPTLLGDGGPQREHDFLYWEFHEQGGKQAVRMGHWKGIRLGVGARPDGPIALYDLRTDIGEEHDVSADHPEVVDAIARAMDAAHEPSDLFRFGRERGPSPRGHAGERLHNERDGLALDRSGFRVVSVSSESTHNGATGDKAIDGSLSTKWHTQWRDAKPGHPHTITIDLGGPVTVHGVRVMARQDGNTNGMVERLWMFVGDAPGIAEREPDGEAVLAATIDEQEVLLGTPARGRFLTLMSRSGHAGTPFACFANIEVLGARD